MSREWANTENVRAKWYDGHPVFRDGLLEGSPGLTSTEGPVELGVTERPLTYPGGALAGAGILFTGIPWSPFILSVARGLARRWGLASVPSLRNWR